MKNVKLFVLRIMFIVSLSVASICTLFVKKEYHYPVRWLLHFLLGSGKDIKVPDYIVVGAKSALERAMRDNDYSNIKLSGMYCVNHSTLYEGSGFHGRPTLFYLLGGFSFYYDEATSRVSGHDYYDWHSNNDGNYFTSPLGEGVVMTTIVKIMGKLFGEDLFVTNGWPSGETGLSNKLWEEFYKVGAKSFNSVFDCYVEFDEDFLFEIRADLATDYFEQEIVGENSSYHRLYEIDDNRAIFEINHYDEDEYIDETSYVYFNFVNGMHKDLSDVEAQIWLTKESKRRAASRSIRDRRRPNRRNSRPVRK